MRIAFAEFSDWDFHVQSVDSAPLGGAHSAVSYLARSLARLGHDVFLFSSLSVPGVYDGVTCLAWSQIEPAFIATAEFDAFVCILATGEGIRLRQVLGSRTRLILWTQHAADEPAVQALLNVRERDAYDGIAMVSEWQRGEFSRAFAMRSERVTVLANAIAPAFADQFPGSSAILANKTWPPILAYTSTPFRGLHLLLDAFPRIRAAIPGTLLKVFSSMKVYQVTQAQDQSMYGRLYQRCRETQGVEYIGSLSQPALASAMRSVMMFSYPNTFAETSCIAAIEAMASGCRVVSSALGALPETTAGFARLVRLDQSPQAYLNQFVGQVVEVLNECRQFPDQSERFLRRQLTHVISESTWEVRARQWVQWLQRLPIQPAI